MARGQESHRANEEHDMKRKAKKRLKKAISKAVTRYGATAVLAFLSTLAANLVSDSVDRETGEQTAPEKPEKKTKTAKAKKRKTARAA